MEREGQEGTPHTSQSRRKFIDYLLRSGLVVWLGTIFYPVWKYLNPPKVDDLDISSVEVGEVAAFQNNTAKIVRFGRSPVIVVLKENGEFRAFSAVCTHLDCTVQYKQDTKQIWCACHNGLYNLEGKNIAGPPPRPLARYAVVESKGTIYVRKEDQA